MGLHTDVLYAGISGVQETNYTMEYEDHSEAFGTLDIV